VITRERTMVAVLISTVFACAPDASAQQVDLLVAAGVAQPIGYWSDHLDTGVGGSVGLEASIRRSPVALRVEAAVGQFGYANFDRSRRITSASANLVLPVAVAGAATYLIAGAGVYRSSIPGTEIKAVSDLGINGGVGINRRSGWLRPFVETRVHTTFADSDNAATRFVPLVLGLRI
jgi:hypothetical protein